MAKDWQALLSRVFDGEALSAEDAEELKAALAYENHREIAHELLLFEGLLWRTLNKPNEHFLAASRHRLLAKLGLARNDGEQLGAGVGRNGGWLAHGGRLALTALLTALVCLMGWLTLGGGYTPVRLEQGVKVLEGIPAERGCTLLAEDSGGSVELGGYAAVSLRPGAQIRVAGKQWDEAFELLGGSIEAVVMPAMGSLTVRTPYGIVRADDKARFIVRFGVDDTLAGREVVHIMVIDGRARVRSSTYGVYNLTAGQSLQLPPAQ